MVHQRAAILMMFMRALTLVLAAVAAVASTACDDFATPAELTKPTILAVVADPPLVSTGGSSQLSVVLAGPDGPMTAETVEWAVVETLPGVPPFGEITPGPAGEATFTAPDPVPEQPDGAPPVSTVQATVQAGDDQIVAVKGMLVANIPSANPTIDVLAVSGEAADAEDTLELAGGSTVTLEVGTDPEAGDDASYAWYSTVGEITQYQSNPCELVAADEARDGWIFVVVRDGRGGVAWRGQRVHVEPPP